MDASELIDKQVADLGDWRGPLFARLRALIHDTDPDIAEEWKWGTGIFSHSGMVCALAAFKDHVKINFFQGAVLDDPRGLFNAGLDAKKTRAIDLYAGDSVNEPALKELIHAAVAHNTAEK